MVNDTAKLLYGFRDKVADLPLSYYYPKYTTSTIGCQYLAEDFVYFNKKQTGKQVYFNSFPCWKSVVYRFPLINTPRQRIANMTYRTDV